MAPESSAGCVEEAGAGAAGGMGFALMSVCGAELKSGFDIVAGVGSMLWSYFKLFRLWDCLLDRLQMPLG